MEIIIKNALTQFFRNKNLHLSKDEFLGFIHPEYAEHMYGILMSETMADLDTVSGYFLKVWLTLN